MSDQQVPQEPPITFQHVIGEQQIEIIMLRKELQNANLIVQQQQELINDLRAQASEPEEKHEHEPTPISKKGKSA